MLTCNSGGFTAVESERLNPSPAKHYSGYAVRILRVEGGYRLVRVDTLQTSILDAPPLPLVLYPQGHRPPVVGGRARPFEREDDAERAARAIMSREGER